MGSPMSKVIIAFLYENNVRHICARNGFTQVTPKAVAGQIGRRASVSAGNAVGSSGHPERMRDAGRVQEGRINLSRRRAGQPVLSDPERPRGTGSESPGTRP